MFLQISGCQLIRAVTGEQILTEHLSTCQTLLWGNPTAAAHLRMIRMTDRRLFVFLCT